MADKKLFVVTAILISFGIIASYTLSTYVVLLFDTTPYHFALRQLIFGLFSLSVVFGLSLLDPKKALPYIGFSLFFISLIAMIAMPFLPASLVTEVGGAKRWIKLFGFSIAPVEFFKVGFIYFLAWSFARKIDDHKGMGLKEETLRFLPYAFLLMVAMVLIAIVQNDLGQVVVISLTLLFMMTLSGSSMKFFGMIASAAFVSFIGFILTADHRVNRIMSWWATAQDTYLSLLPDFLASRLKLENVSEAYQIGHSYNAINNGGFFGVGLGNGTFKLGFLSEVHTDFVLAGIAEEFGFIGVLVVILSFMFFIQRIFKIANRTKEKTYFLFSVGVGLLISLSLLVNAYGISGMTPIKGISVAFLSYGGSTTLAASIAVGMVLMISKTCYLGKEKRYLIREDD